MSYLNQNDRYDPSAPANPPTPESTPVPEAAADALGPLVMPNVDPRRLANYVDDGTPCILFRLPDFPSARKQDVENRLWDDLRARGIQWARTNWCLPGLFIIFEKSENGKLAARTYFSLCDEKFNLNDAIFRMHDEEHDLEIYDADLVPNLRIEVE